MFCYYTYPTPHQLAPKGLVAQLGEQSHQSCDAHLSPEIFFSFQINLRTSLYTGVIGLNTWHCLLIALFLHVTKQFGLDK